MVDMCHIFYFGFVNVMRKNDSFGAPPQSSQSIHTMHFFYKTIISILLVKLKHGSHGYHRVSQNMETFFQNL
jgi:hypothetical protein